MSRLSKSQFIRGLQCQKSLWLYRHRSDLRTEPDEAQQAVFASGTNVGVLAQQLFPGGEEIIFDFRKIRENVQRTKDLIGAGVATIYEASFIHDDVLVMVDILHEGEDGWEMYEVKASTGVKEVHENDVAVQYYVLTGCGLDLDKACLVHINNQYERQGNLDIGQLFTIEDITDTAVSKQSCVADELGCLKDMLEGSEPNIDIGLQCSDPYPCDFSDHCWKHVPDYSIFNLTRLFSSKKFELYYKGVLTFEDMPADYPLSHAQQLQMDAELHDKEFIDKEDIKDFLATISGPVGFLDFETFMQAVPSFDGQRPYQQLPFQYSLHIQDNGRLSHYEFLAEPGSDPRKAFAERLIQDLTKCESILVYSSFERTILNKLAEYLPRRAKELKLIIKRFVDLMAPFQAKDYYTKEMKGSYSIKKVLPALVPELSYDNLGISDGGMAMQAYAQMQSMTDQTTIDKMKHDLLKYCELDTLAMVKILEKLERL